MSVFGILIALGLLVWLAYRGWSILLLAPLSALIAALLAGQPLLANWTQTFMSNAAGFVAQFFPIFLLGALFGKLMDGISDDYLRYVFHVQVLTEPAAEPDLDRASYLAADDPVQGDSAISAAFAASPPTESELAVAELAGSAGAVTNQLADDG